MTLKELIGDDRWGDYAQALDAAGVNTEAEGVLDGEVVHSESYSPEGFGSADVQIIYREGVKFVAVKAWCDTTGWDCQHGGDHKVFESEADARAWIEKAS